MPVSTRCSHLSVTQISVQMSTGRRFGKCSACGKFVYREVASAVWNLRNDGVNDSSTSKKNPVWLSFVGIRAAGTPAVKIGRFGAKYIYKSLDQKRMYEAFGYGTNQPINPPELPIDADPLVSLNGRRNFSNSGDLQNISRPKKEIGVGFNNERPRRKFKLEAD